MFERSMTAELPPHDCLGEDERLLGPADLAGRFAGRVLVVMPAYGEGETLPEVLPRMPRTVGGVPVAVLVVDDGSTDDTTSAALRHGATVARLRENCGGGAALHVGYAIAVAAGATIVATMDADGQHRPEELERVVEPVLSGRAQFAAGSRVLGSAEPGVFARELGIAFFNRVVRVLTRTDVSDCSNGFRAIRTEVLPTLDLREMQFHAAEFLVEALTRGVSYEEVPITVLRRAHGVSKKPPTLRYGWGFCAAIVHSWRRSVARRSLAAAGVGPAPAPPAPGAFRGGSPAAGDAMAGGDFAGGDFAGEPVPAGAGGAPVRAAGPARGRA